MMALALKKKKEDEEASAAQPDQSAPAPTSPSSEQDKLPPPSDERGRRIDKGKVPVRVVGFDGHSQDGLEDQESVFNLF
jgi:GATA-binding protein